MKRAIDFIERLSRWDQLRKLGSSPLVRSSLAFAAAGYILLWNENFQHYLTVKFDGHFFLWRIWMLYYGGISLALATGLYSWFCPKPIKDHNSAFELAQSECQYMATMGLGQQYFADVKKLEGKCTAAERELWPPNRPEEALINHVRGTPKEADYLVPLIVYAWRLHNIRRPTLRPFILALYAVGFILVGFPAVVTFFQVTLAGLRSFH